MRGALGLIQVEGLAAAMAAADAALKAADVTLLNTERVQGGGLMLIRLAGDVSSVQAAVDAGMLVAERVGTQARGHVIARPAWSQIESRNQTDENKKNNAKKKKGDNK